MIMQARKDVSWGEVSGQGQYLLLVDIEVRCHVFAVTTYGIHPVWSKYSNAQRVRSLHLSQGRINPPSEPPRVFRRLF